MSSRRARRSTLPRRIPRHRRHTWAARAAAQRRRRISFSEAGQRFIDAHLVEFINAAPAARQELAQRIFEEAKTREVELNAILWTVKSVKTRLHNALKLGNAADAAVPALNQH